MKIVERNVKIGSWNVRSMTGRGREIVEVCKRRNIGILCVQETKWTGKGARELGEGFMILYSGEKSSRNRVGVNLSPEKIVEVSRSSDRLIKLKLVIAGEIFNSVSICLTEWRNREDKGGVFVRLGRSDIESAENREDCSRS